MKTERTARPHPEETLQAIFRVSSKLWLIGKSNQVPKNHHPMDPMLSITTTTITIPKNCDRQSKVAAKWNVVEVLVSNVIKAIPLTTKQNLVNYNRHRPRRPLKQPRKWRLPWLINTIPTHHLVTENSAIFIKWDYHSNLPSKGIKKAKKRHLVNRKNTF